MELDLFVSCHLRGVRETYYILMVFPFTDLTLEATAFGRSDGSKVIGVMFLTSIIVP